MAASGRHECQDQLLRRKRVQKNHIERRGMEEEVEGKGGERLGKKEEEKNMLKCKE